MGPKYYAISEILTSKCLILIRAVYIKMTKNNFSQTNGLLDPVDPETPRILDNEGSRRSSIAGSVMDFRKASYEVSPRRWFILGIFVIYSASNSMQWTQYTIIQDVVMRYYGVSGKQVSWTSMIYMITYIPLILVESWFLDKTVSDIHVLYYRIVFLVRCRRRFSLSR